MCCDPTPAGHEKRIFKDGHHKIKRAICHRIARFEGGMKKGGGKAVPCTSKVLSAVFFKTLEKKRNRCFF